MIPDAAHALAAMQTRVSTRSYSGLPVEPALIQRLLMAAASADHLTSVPPRIELINGVDVTRRVLKFVVGPYGLVQNVPHLLAGVLPTESEAARIDLGYVLEQIILEATRLGLGTCWITGSYDAHSAGDVVGLRPGEVAAAVCSVGYPSTTRLGRFHTQTIRRLAGGRRRKPLTETVFVETWGASWKSSEADPEPAGLLAHARIAPSAHNGQPWRFIVSTDRIVLAMARPEPIDAGIVMAHVALAAASLGCGGKWRLHLQDDALAHECGLPRGVMPVAVFSWRPVG